VSRATVRKVVRGRATEFKYERGVQPAPKLGEWVEVLTAILEQEARLPRRERRSKWLPSVTPSLRAPPDVPDGLAADQPLEWSYEPVLDDLPVPDPVMA